jgi:hypothetical protein
VGRLPLALIAALALAATGCPPPVGPLLSDDLSRQAPRPEHSTLVGKNVVVRLARAQVDRWSAILLVDVLPPSAELRGARVRVVRRGRVYEGPAKVDHWLGAQTYRVDGPDRLDAPSGPRPGPDSTMVWLGPICLANACETVVVRDGDWPRADPPE